MSHNQAQREIDSTAVGDIVPETPRASVRIQFHVGFNFEDARRRVPYLHRLGISHLYASPILTARAGSTHGYDVVDPSAINPELGGEDGLRSLVAELRAHGMGMILDIVPNHMAVGYADNRWWLDVLEWGPESRYANFFDIDWDVPDPALNGRVLAPFLGTPYGDALNSGDIRLHFDDEAGRFYAAHFDHRFPIAPRQYAAMLARSRALAVHAAAFHGAMRQARQSSSRKAAFEDACRDLSTAARGLPGEIEYLLERYSPAVPEGRRNLHTLLERQHYRLAWWRTAADEINWRRFFDVSQLAGLRMQERAAFEAVHATIFRLYAEGLIDGLRIDHVDGLADPRAYCRQLRTRLDKLRLLPPAGTPKRSAYVVVEKILAPREQLHLDWRIDGSSGYVFMDQVSALLHDPTGERPLRQLWNRKLGHKDSFRSRELQARRFIPQELFASEFGACAHALHAIARAQPETRDWTFAAIRRGLAELLVHFPVYRTYADARGRNEEDDAIMRKVVADAQRTCRPGERELIACMDRWLGGEAPQDVSGAAARRARLRAIARFQQLTSPVAAKSVEDTAFYRYGTLLSRNEVGANPGEFFIDADRFHQACVERQIRYPAAMLATATHDHKRGEDLRARLAVISEVPQRWEALIDAWSQLNAPLRSASGEGSAPDNVDEYMLYQMLVGVWPLALDAGDEKGLALLYERVNGWQQKALREAKRHSTWIDPDQAYEAGCQSFLSALLDTRHSRRFLDQLAAFVRDIARAGAINGLSQTLLRLTTPGVPDLYQGCEYWDFSLVDPDNRRPVDFDERMLSLQSTLPDARLLEDWHNGWIKQRLIQRILAIRHRSSALFSRGSYRPLVVRGALSRNFLAFTREYRKQAVLIAIPRFSSALLEDSSALRLRSVGLGDATIQLPASLGGRHWYDLLNRRALGRLASPFSPALDSSWPLICLYTD